jgi:hypothetical protein
MVFGFYHPAVSHISQGQYNVIKMDTILSSDKRKYERCPSGQALKKCYSVFLNWIVPSQESVA